MIETFLSIASFSISVGGLISMFIVKGAKKEIVLGVVITALFVTSGIALYTSHQHEQQLELVQGEILKALSQDTITFEEIYQRLYYTPYEILNEALFVAIGEGVIGHRVMRFQNSGMMTSVRVFYAR